MCASLSNKILILGCIFLATGFTSALIGIMTSVWAVKEDSDDHGFSKFVSYGLWRFRRCGGFRFNEECTKGRLVRAEIEQFGAEGLFLCDPTGHVIWIFIFLYSTTFKWYQCMDHNALLEIFVYTISVSHTSKFALLFRPWLHRRSEIRLILKDAMITANAVMRFDI